MGLLHLAEATERADLDRDAEHLALYGVIGQPGISGNARK